MIARIEVDYSSSNLIYDRRSRNQKCHFCEMLLFQPLFCLSGYYFFAFVTFGDFFLPMSSYKASS